MMSYFRQQVQISSPALNMQSLSYGRIVGKNQEKISTISSRTFSHRFVSFLFIDFRVSFSVISYSMTDRQPSDILNFARFLKFIIISITQPIMKHQYSKSLGVLPRTPIRISQTENDTPKSSILKLPGLKPKESFLNNSQSQVKTKRKRESKIQPQTIDPHQLHIIEKIRQKAKLLAQLKQKIRECGDNLFMKRLLSEIKFTSLGKIGIQLWQNAEQFEHCDRELLENLQYKYQYKMTEQSLRTMDFINNVCRFTLADYKRKKWLQKQKDVNIQFDKNRKRMKQVGKKVQSIETPETKLQIVLSLAGIKQQCFAKKQCYLNWKQRAIEKLKSNPVKCQILRAQIFTEGFY